MVVTCFYIQFFQPCLFPGPGKSDSDTDSRVKVRVSRVKSGNHAGTKGDSLVTRQTEELETTVQRELEKAGLGGGGRVFVFWV